MSAQSGDAKKPLPSSADRRRRKPELDSESEIYLDMVKRLGGLSEKSPEERRQAVEVLFTFLDKYKAESLGSTDLVQVLANELGKAGDYKLASQVFERAAKNLENATSPTFHEYQLQFLGNAKRAQAFAEPLKLEGLLPDGTRFPTAEYKGKVVLIEFWEMGCPGCARELPKLKQLHAKFKDRGFDVVGVCVDRDAAAVGAFMQRQGIPWRTIVPGRRGDFEVASHYAITLTPTLWLMGPDGALLSTNAFPTPELDSLVDELLKKIEKR